MVDALDLETHSPHSRRRLSCGCASYAQTASRLSCTPDGTAGKPRVGQCADARKSRTRLRGTTTAIAEFGAIQHKFARGNSHVNELPIIL